MTGGSKDKPKKAEAPQPVKSKSGTKDNAQVKAGKKRKSRLREKYLGRMIGETDFQASDGQWYSLDKADMSHITDAVTWWNETGRKYGAKSSEVRKWMLDSNNYTLDHYSINRSAGSKLGQTYLPPLK